MIMSEHVYEYNKEVLKEMKELRDLYVEIKKDIERVNSKKNKEVDCE